MGLEMAGLSEDFLNGCNLLEGLEAAERGAYPVAVELNHLDDIGANQKAPPKFLMLLARNRLVIRMPCHVSVENALTNLGNLPRGKWLFLEDYRLLYDV